MTPNGVPATQPDSSLPNLLPNGNFKEPNDKNDGPKHWQDVDRLVWQWAADPAAPERGKVIRIDTGIDEQFAYKWWVEHFVKGVPLDQAPARPPGNAGYGSIGGNDGGYYWSGFFPIKPGRAYRVYVDMKGPGAKVFMRAYTKELPLFFGDEEPATLEVLANARGEPKLDANGRPVRHRPRYSYQKWFPAGGSNQWTTYTSQRPMHPTASMITKDVRFARIMLYPYWPNAVYWFDNIRVYEVDPDPDPPLRPPTEADYVEGKVARPAPPATQPGK